MEQEYNIHPQILASEKLVIGRKVFFLDLKENARGRFLQVTEDVAGRRNRVMLPVEVFADFVVAVQRLVEVNSTMEP